MDDGARLDEVAEARPPAAEDVDSMIDEAVEAWPPAVDDSDEGLEEADDEVAAARPPLRHVPLAVLTTVIGAGLALTLMTGAWARPADRGALDEAGADVAVAATQQYRAPAGFSLKSLKREAFAAAAPTAAEPSEAASDAPVSLPSGKVAPAGEAQAYAAKLIAAHGWKSQQFACLAQLWGRESGWNAHAGRTNGPYGIPQAYPGSKMAAAGGDWVNDHRVQIRWGLGYVIGRYGTPCGAWTHWQSAHSY